MGWSSSFLSKLKLASWQKKRMDSYVQSSSIDGNTGRSSSVAAIIGLNSNILQEPRGEAIKS
jgi:hypothetical protein